MHTPKALPPSPPPPARAPVRDARPSDRALPPEGRRLARTAGAALAATSLVFGFAAAAQTAAYGPQPETSGVLPWVFALFAAAAVLGVFLVVLTLGRRPTGHEGRDVPGSRNARTSER